MLWSGFRSNQPRAGAGGCFGGLWKPSVSTRRTSGGGTRLERYLGSVTDTRVA